MKKDIDELESMVCAMTAVWGYARGLLTKDETEKLLRHLDVRNDLDQPASIRDFAGTMNKLAVPLRDKARSL